MLALIYHGRTLIQEEVSTRVDQLNYQYVEVLGTYSCT